MKNIWLALMVLALATACATSGGAPEADPILGEWIGSLEGDPFKYVFNVDSTATMTFDQSVEQLKFHWFRDADGTYQFREKPDSTRSFVTGVIEKDGRLAVRDAEDDHRRVIYLKRGVLKPKPDPAKPKPKAAVQAVDPKDDPVIGEWVGTGIYKILKVVFKADKSVVVGEENAKWTRDSSGTYLIYYKEGEPPDEGMKATLESDGRLGLMMDPESDEVIHLNRPGAGKPTGPPPDPKALVGEWTFVYTKNAIMPIAPGFTSIAFDGDGGVRWISPFLEKDMKGKVKAKDRTLTFSGGGSGSGSTKVANSGDFEYAFEDDGKTLILAPQSHAPDITADWVFKKKADILANPIVGTWMSKNEELGLDADVELEVLADGRRTFTMHFPPDSEFAKNPPPPNKDGFFVFWQSALGPAVTHVNFAREMGMFSFDLMLYERKGETLTTTPIRVDPEGGMKAVEEVKMTWTLKK